MASSILDEPLLSDHVLQDTFVTPGDLNLHDAAASRRKIQQTYRNTVKPFLVGRPSPGSPGVGSERSSEPARGTGRGKKRAGKRAATGRDHGQWGTATKMHHSTECGYSRHKRAETNAAQVGGEAICNNLRLH